MAEPYKLMACDSENPALISPKGKIIAISEELKDATVRITVTGVDETIKGFSSLTGFLSLFFLKIKIAMARVKEKTYDKITAIPALIAPS